MMKKILIIEDNTDVRENLAEILMLSGYEAITAENGKTGAAKAQTELPDLILCDIMMPELDGYGVLHIMSRSAKTADIPFIFLTAKAEKEDFRKGMALGADDYITKPFDDAVLLQTIESRFSGAFYRRGPCLGSHQAPVRKPGGSALPEERYDFPRRREPPLALFRRRRKG
jgi:CheY-like chemotaxis protein